MNYLNLRFFIFQDYIDNNNNLNIYIKDDQLRSTFIIKIHINFNYNNFDNLIQNLENGIYYFRATNSNNEEILFETNLNCNINWNMADRDNNYNVRSLEHYKNINFYQNILDDNIWILIFGRLLSM